MKSIKIIALALILAIVGIRCSEDFVNTTNKNALTPELLYISADNLEYLVRAMYASYKQRDLWGAQYFSHLIGDLSHEVDLQWNSDPNWNDVTTHEMKSGSTWTRDAWNSWYRVVGQANSVLYYAARIEGTATAADLARIQMMKGEAYFTRAYAYFQLIQLYGEAYQPIAANHASPGVPLITTMVSSVSEAELPKSTVGEVYTQIVADFKAASELLPPSRPTAQVARLTKWAALGLLGKVYVTMQDWTNGATALKDVIDNGKSHSGQDLALLPFHQYKDMFVEKHEFSTESIFELNMVHDQARGNRTDQGPGNYTVMFIAPCYLNDAGVSTASGWSNVFVHQKAVDRIKNDPRGRVAAYQPGMDSIKVNGVKRVVAKYFGVAEPDIEGWSFRKYTSLEKTANESGNNNGSNFHILRLPDVFLLYAEALYAQNNENLAREYVNKVRRRAYGKANYNEADATIDHPSTLTGAALLEAIQEERFIELFGEGHTWFDVRRWGNGQKAATYFGKTRGGIIKFDHPHDYWLPIPITELERNPNLVQSTGH